MATAKKAPAKKAVAKKAAEKTVAKKAAAVPEIVEAAAPAKKAAKKAASADKAVAAKKVPAKRAPNAALMKELTPSPILAAIVGAEPIARPVATKKIWDYIKKHELQDSVNRRNINADDKLKALFAGADSASMFDLAKYVSANLK